MMACGKSQTGPKLAELLRYKFIDLDTVIETLAKKSINTIFKEDGEKIFRDIESQCLKESIKIPSFLRIFDADLKPSTSSVNSLFTNILSA